MDDGRPGTARESGVLAALRRLGATTVELLYTRLELVATELEEERNRILRLLLLTVAAIFFLVAGILLLTFFIIIVAWDTHRVLAAGLLTVLYFVIGGIFAINARNAAKTHAKLFTATLAELKKDRDGLS